MTSRLLRIEDELHHSRRIVKSGDRPYGLCTS